MRKNSSLITILAFGLYFLVGAGALLVGSSLTQLIGVYGRTMDAVVLLGSSFAIGRVSTVGLTGRLVEKIGAKAVYAISVLATCVYFVGIPLFPNYYAGMAAAFLGGLNPIGAILASFFIQHITAGGAYVDKSMYCAQISDLISSIIIYLCGFVLFMKYAMNTAIAKREEKAALKEKERAQTPEVSDNGKGGDQ